MSESTDRTPYWKRLESWFLAAAFLILVVNALSAWRNLDRLSVIRSDTRAARDAVDQLEEILIAVRDAESSERDFVLTGEDQRLEAFDRIEAQFPGQFKALNTLAPDQKTAVQSLKRLVDEKFVEMRATIALRRSRGLEPALHMVVGGQNWDLAEKIRGATHELKAIKAKESQAGSDSITRLRDQLLDQSLGGSLVLCLLLLLCAISMHSGAERREELIGALQEDDRRLRDLREKAESAEERVRNVLESIGDGFLAVDHGWNITYCNAAGARILNRVPQDVLGKSFWLEFPESETDGNGDRYREAARAGTPVQFESFIKSRNSYWDQSIYPSRDSLSIYFRDVTERRRFEERARHAHKLESLGVLAGGIAHDFNNLLTAILGSASLMMEELPESSPARPLAENVIHASERAGQLTRQMLAYSGRGRFIVEPLDLAVQIREITALLESSITAQVQLILDLKTDGVLIDADGGQIQQLIMNLVINGAEALGSGNGRVIVSTRVQELDAQFTDDYLAGDDIEPGSYILLEVHDTGAGMDRDTLSKIFDPFFTTKFTGRGLGLAAVLGIVRGHRGAIKVYSNPGRGTTFKVFLPVSKTEASHKEPTPAIDPHGSGTILVVDDEVVVQKLARSTLELYGYRVLVAANGQEALAIMDSGEEAVELVLLDMTMPIMSGEETLVRLRTMAPSVKVIASSGYNEIEAIRRFGAGITGFLQKPYRASQLLEKVKVSLV